MSRIQKYGFYHPFEIIAWGFTVGACRVGDTEHIWVCGGYRQVKMAYKQFTEPLSKTSHLVYFSMNYCKVPTCSLLQSTSNLT